MAKRIILSYLHEGEEKVFDFDTYNETHQRRIIQTMQWAAREGVEIYCNPKKNLQESVAPKQIAMKF